MTSKKTSVIIPYYQKETGILRRSITSILNQEFDGCIDIIVIDDGSPVSADQELSAIQLPQGITVTIIEQENKGPAAARNTGLDAVSSTCYYIAFLDSDDEWAADHLRSAHTALAKGYDFFFSDFYQLDQDISAFDRAARININQHPLLPESDHLHRYQGNMLDQILHGNIIGTSTVVYKRALNPKLRFREDLVKAGEDYLFWSELTLSGSNIAFSSKQECTYGKGINIYSGSSWGDDDYLELIHYEIKYRVTIMRALNLTDEQKKYLKDRIRILRRALLSGFIHDLTRKKTINKYFFSTLAFDPGLLISIPHNIYVLINDKLSNKLTKPQ